MRREDQGWWRTEVDASPGARYGFLLDEDETVLPDPRSPDAPRWIVVSGDVYDAQPAAIREGYRVHLTARGVNFADGTLRETVHLLEKQTPPATLPAERR